MGNEVAVNGKRVTDPASHIDILHDRLTVDGEPLTLQRDLYLMMNKCGGLVCANKDGEHRTVFDLVYDADESLRRAFLGGELHTVGRLDIDTEGLLLLTTDGALTHRLISPKTHVPKTYAVGLRDGVEAAARADYVRRFAQGLHIPREGHESEFDAQGALLEWISDSDRQGPKRALYGERSDCLLTIYEGKFHQVKRMFAAVGNEVVYLKRISMGALTLDPQLPPGSFRELTEQEVLIFSAERG